MLILTHCIIVLFCQVDTIK